MIHDIGNKITSDYGKHNWIDQNNVVFGYDEQQQCCECWGWAVYDPKTREKVADDPSDMPYHFDFAAGAREAGEEIYTDEADESTDIVHVTLVHDDDPEKILIFECYNCHNGYYYHDFSFGKIEEGELQRDERN